MSTVWYECKVKYRKTDDIGGQKVTTEPYLVDAISYTEAESRIYEEMAAYVSEEFKITTIKVANFSEIHPFENCDRWFKSKIALVAYDEESGKERKTNIHILLQHVEFLLSSLAFYYRSEPEIHRIKISHGPVLFESKFDRHKICSLSNKRYTAI